MFVKEQKHYADSAGTSTTQQRVRVQTQIEAISIGSHGFEAMRTLAQPAGYGWEWMDNSIWDWDSEIAELPSLLAEKVASPSVEPGRYDLLIHPSNLWLTIHESIGHATELDRAIGYEANYAGTSFATPDKLGNLKYGSGSLIFFKKFTTSLSNKPNPKKFFCNSSSEIKLSRK